MEVNLKQQLDKLWLKTDLFKPDEDIKFRTMKRLNDLFTEFTYFIENFPEFLSFPSFDKIFLSENYYDYLRLLKNELKKILREVNTTEQLTGVFTGLLGHEISFGSDNENYLNFSYEKKEFIMLHTLKLLDMAYYEEFNMKLPLPDDYRDWLNESYFHWEKFVKELSF